MTGVAIFYGGKDAFYPQATPYATLDFNNIYYGELWAKQEVVTLEGKLTGCTFDLITTAQDTLRNNFKRSFQSLQIVQQDSTYSGVVFQKDLAEIDSIDFAQQPWRGDLNYTIRLRCYPSGYFSGAFGILDPRDTWDFREQDNRSLQAVHTVACRGLNTSAGTSNALSNAIDWASSKRGTTGIISPVFIQDVTPDNFCLINSQENIDRFNGTYSITDTYINDLTRAGYGVLRYSAELNSGDNAITVSLNGSVRGCNQDIQSVRNTFSGFSPLAAANYLYQGVFHLNDLNPVPLQQTIQEDPYNTVLTFSYAYDNNNLPDVYYDYTVSIASGDTIAVSVDGQVIGRGGDVKTRLQRCKDYAQTINFYQLITPFVADFGVNASTLNPNPLSKNVSIDESKGTLSIGATFGQQAFSNPLEFIDYTIEVRPAVQRVNYQPQLNQLGIYTAVDMGYASRSLFSVRGSAKGNLATNFNVITSATKSFAQALFTQYARGTNIVLEQSEVTPSETNDRQVSFNFRWSMETAAIASSPYSTVTSL